MDFVLFSVGLVMLLWSGDRLVTAAAALAQKAGLSQLVVGVVIVGLGTSLPELVASIDAAVRDAPGLAVGNVVGSNIANILLVLGLSALVSPVQCRPEEMQRDLPCLLVSCGMVLIASQNGTIGRGIGLLLTIALVGYLVLLLKSARRGLPVDIVPESGGGIRSSVLWSLAALAVLLLGAHWLVSGALGIAVRFGLSDSLVGLTLVALGTSLPEMAVAVAALLRRHADLGIGNIIGSTLFNLLGVLGLTALVRPLDVPQDIAAFDIWVMVASILALVLFARTGWRITRSESAILLLGYPIYLTILTR